jgi:protein TonB
VIDVKLAVVRNEPLVVEKPLPKKAVIRPVPRPVQIVPQAAPREEPVPERIVSQPMVMQSMVENQGPRVPAPAPAAEPPVQLATVPKTRSSEPDFIVRYLHNPPPQYPWQARRLGIEGRVVLHVEILQNGNSGRIEIRQSSGHELLDQAAIKAVGGWRFDPARIAGSPITAWADVPISFRLTER